VRPTRAEINLEALRHNLRVARRHAGDARVWAVLKADAYGHGAPAVARTLERAKIDGFCVALLEEAVELREAGIVAPILVMGGHYGNAHDEVVARSLTPVVHDLAQAEAFARLVRSGETPGPVEVHLKVDTGMARLGVTMSALPDLAARLAQMPEIRVRGLMTHLACADAPTGAEIAEQMLRFDEATAQLVRHGIRPDVRHAANSAALLRASALEHGRADVAPCYLHGALEHGRADVAPGYLHGALKHGRADVAPCYSHGARLDAVRPGIALFGVSPSVDGHALAADLKPVMRVRTEVVALRDVDEGSPVGYGGTWKAPRRSRIATLPMGYADGLSRRLGNRGHVLVRGARAPIVGAVSMDMTMVDVTGVPGASVRDEVVVLGAQEGPLGRAFIGADEIAGHADTIAWEVLTSVSRRVPRFYREP
jgi:alanine racemase